MIDVVVVAIFAVGVVEFAVSYGRCSWRCC